MKDGDVLARRFAIFSLLQGFVLILCICLSAEQFGEAVWQRQESAALILASKKDAPGWPKEMTGGLQQACDDLGYDLYIEDEVPVGSGECSRVVEKLVARGVKRIFLANPGYQEEAEALAARYPRVSFFANSVGENVSDSILAYSVRYYEVRYLAGVLAGMRTSTGVVGYVAPFPAAETRRGINAFALGVQSVRPGARILLKWTGQWISPEKEEEAVYRLKLEGADVLCYFAATRSVAEEAERQDLTYIDFHKSPYRSGNCLAAIETDWQAVFTELLRMNSRRDEERVYWRGMFDKVVRLRPVDKLTPREETAFVRARAALWQGYPVFSGEITDQAGVRRCSAGEVIPDGDILSRMDWLVRGVELVESR